METETVSTELITEEQQRFLEDVRSFCESECVSITVTSNQELSGAEELGKKLARYGRDIEKQRKEAKAPILEQGRKIDAAYNEIKSLVDDRVKKIGGASREYRAELERKRIEEQRKADEIARKERERIEAQARKQREKEELARREAEEAARKAQEAANEQERAKLQAEAEKRRQQAERAAREAEAKQAVAASVTAHVVQAEAPKTAGVSERQNWKAEVTDKQKFVEYAIRTEGWEYIDVNMPNLNRYAKMIKNSKEIPGVRIFNDTSTVFKG